MFLSKVLRNNPGSPKPYTSPNKHAPERSPQCFAKEHIAGPIQAKFAARIAGRGAGAVEIVVQVSVRNTRMGAMTKEVRLDAAWGASCGFLGFCSPGFASSVSGFTAMGDVSRASSRADTTAQAQRATASKATCVEHVAQ